MGEEMKTVPMNIARYMEDRNLSDAVVAVQLGKHPNTVYRWRTGQCEPNKKTKLRIMTWSNGVVTPATWAELYAVAA